MNSIKDHLTANEIKETLTGLRKDIGSYSSAYKATMERVNGQQKRRHGLAMRILAWVVHAKRPLSFGELNHALATRPGKPSIDGDDTYAKEVILSVCAGLVTLDDTYGSPVRLIHYTAQEYLCDTWMQWFSTESAEIVDVCLTYLLFDEFKHPCIDWQTLSSRHYHYTLFEYAAQNWAYHFKDKKCRRKGDCKTTRMALIFLLDRFSVCSAVQALDRLSPEGYDLMCHGIHLTAYLGLEDLTMLLIDVMRVKPDLADIGLRTPLWWAARQGHTDVVKALLGTKRVNVNRRDRYNGNWPYTYGQTPLAVAAGNGHEEVVDVLLATERTVFDTRDLRGRSPLLLAAEKGHENIVRILLDTGHSDVNEIDYYDRTPLSCAAANGHEGVVKALLATKGVDVNWKVYGQTPLFDAVRCSHEGAVKALLAAEGVDIHWEDPHGRTALDVAKHNLHTGIIGMLKAAGASDTSKSKRQEQPTE
jgi:ankyrin repeat protein